MPPSKNLQNLVALVYYEATIEDASAIIIYPPFKRNIECPYTKDLEWLPLQVLLKFIILQL